MVSIVAKGSADFIRSFDGLAGLSDDLLASASEALSLPSKDRGAALDDWRTRALADNPALRDVLTPTNMVRISNVPEAVAIQGEFHEALLNGMQNADTAAATYARRMADAISSPSQAAAFEESLVQHAQGVNRLVTETASSAGIDEAEVLRRMRNASGVDGGSNQADAAAATRSPNPPGGKDETLEAGLTASDVRRISSRAFLRNTGILAVGGPALYLGTVYANNSLEGRPMDAAIDGVQAAIGRENFEKLLGAYEDVQLEVAEFYGGGAKHIFTDSGYVTEEDLADPEMDKLITGAALYAGGGTISSAMHIMGAGTGSQYLDAYGEAEERLVEEAEANGLPKPSRFDIAGEAFTIVRDELRAERALAAEGNNTTPDPYQQGGNSAGTPAATLAERRRNEGNTDVEDGEIALDTVLGKARQTFSAVAEQGIELAQEKAEAGFFSKLFNPLTTLFFAIVGAVSHAIQKWAMNDSDIAARTSELNADGEQGNVVSQLDGNGLFRRVFDGPTQHDQEPGLEPTS